jgi:hypothetical protein
MENLQQLALHLRVQQVVWKIGCNAKIKQKLQDQAKIE